jgi:hypothetical protein
MNIKKKPWYFYGLLLRSVSDMLWGSGCITLGEGGSREDYCIYFFSPKYNVQTTELFNFLKTLK